MIFGDEVTSAATTAAAAWISPARRGPTGTVGGLVPNAYASMIRLHAPPPIPGGATYRDLYEVVADIGARHTSRPDRAWFAVWEGHGFDTVTRQVAWWEPPVDDADRRARDAQRATLRTENRRRTAAIGAELDMVPRFALPDHTYYLMAAAGPVDGTLAQSGSVLARRSPMVRRHRR